MELNKIKSDNKTLKLTNGVEFELRLFTLNDEIWLANHYPEEQDIQKLFGNGGDFSTVVDDDIIKVIYRQIIDKSLLKAIKKTDLNEKGEPVTIKLGGIELFKSMLMVDDMVTMFTVLCELFIASRPVLENDGKKKLKNQQTGV